MRANTFPKPITINEVPPFGDVALASTNPSVQSETVLTQLMTDALRAAHSETDSEALMLLRRNFPQASLSARLTALAALMRR